MPIDWKKKSGSNINAIGYDAAKSTLYIRFVSGKTDSSQFEKGKVYSYAPFTLKQFETFDFSPSVGSYFHSNIKSNKKLKVNQVNEPI